MYTYLTISDIWQFIVQDCCYLLLIISLYSIVRLIVKDTIQ